VLACRWELHGARAIASSQSCRHARHSSSPAQVFGTYFPFAVAVGASGPESHAEALASNLVGVLAWIAVARLMYLRKVFVAL